MPGRRGRRWMLWSTIATLAIGTLAATSVWMASQPVSWYRRADLLEDVAAPTVAQGDAMEARIVAFCGNCHAMPSAASFPRDVWHNEVLRGCEFYARSGLTHLDPPPIQAAVDYFRSRAPRELVFPVVPDATGPPPARFSVEKWPVDQHAILAPAIAHLRWARLQAGGRPMLLVCDMHNGNVLAVDPNDRSRPPTVFARLNHPCHAEPVDLDGDNAIDLVVADLGSSVPFDHDLGRVIWLRRNESQQKYEEIVVASGLGRVADVRPADLNRDGQIDLVVADFGLHRTGQVLWLQNLSTPESGPRFVPQQIDPRPGAIHVPVVDLDGDGRLDFLGLISQEYETVEAYMNQGSGDFEEPALRFHRKRLWTGPDLTFGSSGIEPVDLDQDGDIDVLYTNGDAFDNSYANPSHGIQWLENLGDEQFACHRLTDLVGAYRALAGDVDLDGDWDIIAVAWLPEQVKPVILRERSLPAIVCLEQTAPGIFERHTLEQGAPRYATLELADFDGDGDLDFAVGSHMQTLDPKPHWLTIWRNDLK